MGTLLPTALGKNPLVEALFEIRFEAARPAAGDLLPGILYSALKDHYPEVVALPLSRVSREIRDNDPNFTYQPSHQLSGEDGAIQTGDRVLALALQAYPGWHAFKHRIESLLDKALETKLVDSVERYSLRYINLIPLPDSQTQLNALNARIEFRGIPAMERGFQLRTEFDSDNFTSILQLIPNSFARMNDGRTVSGLIIDIDTQNPTDVSNFFSEKSQLLEEAHDTLKALFFSLISDHTLSQLDPTYQ